MPILNFPMEIKLPVEHHEVSAEDQTLLRSYGVGGRKIKVCLLNIIFVNQDRTW